ncbi:MAG: hypothetical protein WBY94_28765, partial [Polyangiaceae bacterium]
MGRYSRLETCGHIDEALGEPARRSPADKQPKGVRFSAHEMLRKSVTIDLLRGEEHVSDAVPAYVDFDDSRTGSDDSPTASKRARPVPRRQEVCDQPPARANDAGSLPRKSGEVNCVEHGERRDDAVKLAVESPNYVGDLAGPRVDVAGMRGSVQLGEQLFDHSGRNIYRSDVDTVGSKMNGVDTST